MTTLFPAASAGASFQMAKMKGKFQGAMAPTTPIGRRVSSDGWPGLGVPAAGRARGGHGGSEPEPALPTTAILSGHCPARRLHDRPAERCGRERDGLATDHVQPRPL